MEGILKFWIVFFGLAVILGFVAIPIHIANWNNHRDTVTITVEEKDRVANSEGGSESRIYTDKGVYGVGDDWINGQFNSAYVYSDLEVGETYTVETVGFRNGFFSFFPNILKVVE